MQQLEGFHYVTVLYINMGYYTISLMYSIQYMKAIVTELGEFRYNHIHMGMCTLGGIFQANIE